MWHNQPKLARAHELHWNHRSDWVLLGYSQPPAAVGQVSILPSLCIYGCGCGSEPHSYENFMPVNATMRASSISPGK